MRSLAAVALLCAAAVASEAHAQEYLHGSTPTVSACAGTYYDSGGASAAYSDSEDSAMTFCDPGSGAVTLTFTSLDLESCCDSLTIYDGPDTTGPVLGTYTGTTSPGAVSGSGSCLTTHFESDGSVTRDGWAATLSCGPIDTSSYRHGRSDLFETCEGTYYDSGGASSGYLDGESSTTTFCDPAGTGPISMSFTSFATESCCDHLTAYDGPDTTGTNLGSFSGSTSPGIVTSTGGCLTFTFTSDGSVPGEGWEATITCGATGGENGAPCTDPSTCDSGYCVDGLCCADACGGGATDDCQACSVGAGGSDNGTCTSVTDGRSCDDGLLCNGTETCASGSCEPSTPLDCDDFDPCTTDSCVEGVGCQHDAIPTCDFDAGPGFDGGPGFDAGSARRDAGGTVRSGRRSRGCCAVAGTDDGDPAGWTVTLGALALAVIRRRRRGPPTSRRG